MPVVALVLLVLPLVGLAIGMVVSAVVPVLGWLSGDAPAPADAHASSLRSMLPGPRLPTPTPTPTPTHAPGRVYL